MNAIAVVGGSRLFDIVAVLILVEMLVLSIYRARTGRGMVHGEIGSFLGSGLALFLALAAMARGNYTAVLATLVIALGFHLWDLYQRWE